MGDYGRTHKNWFIVIISGEGGQKSWENVSFYYVFLYTAETFYHAELRDHNSFHRIC
jgi:hypothetical protein